MVAVNRPDLMNVAIKKIIGLRYPVSEGSGWTTEDGQSWRLFAEDFGQKSGEGNQPEYGMLHPIFRLWVDSLTPDIESNPDQYGLAQVQQSKNHPNPYNYLPNVGDGVPDADFDANGNPIYKRLDKDGNPVGVTPAEQAQMRKVLGNAVPSSADALQTKGLGDNSENSDNKEPEQKTATVTQPVPQATPTVTTTGPAVTTETNESGNPKGKPNDASSGASIRTRTN